MEKGRLAGRLSRINRPIDHFLAGYDFDGATIKEAQHFGNQMEAAVQRFMVGKIATERGTIDKRTAHIMLGQALARLALVQKNGGGE